MIGRVAAVEKAEAEKVQVVKGAEADAGELFNDSTLIKASRQPV